MTRSDLDRLVRDAQELGYMKAMNEQNQKLAIAVEALEFYERYWEKQFPDLPVIAREALAKIK